MPLLEGLLRYRTAGLLVLWVGLLLLLRSPQQSYLAHDEGYYAQQARWILANHDWVTVGWWGDLAYDRTIGLQWLIAVSFGLFGLGEGAARLPSMLACLGAVLLTWRLGLQLSPKAAVWGAAILPLIPIWMQASRLAMQDIVLVCLELVGIWALLAAEQWSRGRWAWAMLAGGMVGLGFFIKTFMVVLPLLALLPYLVLEHRRHRHLSNPGLYLGLLIGFLPVAIWLGLSIDRYGLLPVEQLFGKLLALSREDGAFEIPTRPWFYLWNIPINSFPWTFFAIAGGLHLWRTPGYRRKGLWLGYPLLLLLLLMAFDTRTWYYPLQLYPFVALLAGVALHQLTEQYLSTRPYDRRLPYRLSWAAALVGGLLLAVGLGLLLAPLPNALQAFRTHGWIGVAGGLGWLVPLAVMQQDRNRSWMLSRGWLWQLGWLLGPWCAIATAFLTGLWGNYAPDVKTALQSAPIGPILQQHPIDFVQPDANPDAVLLTAYTPHLGQNLPDLKALPADTYTWVKVRPQETLPSGYVTVGRVREWLLVTPAPQPSPTFESPQN